MIQWGCSVCEREHDVPEVVAELSLQWRVVRVWGAGHLLRRAARCGAAEARGTDGGTAVTHSSHCMSVVEGIV